MSWKELPQSKYKGSENPVKSTSLTSKNQRSRLIFPLLVALLVFQLEEGGFHGETTGVTGEGTVSTNYPMAGDKEGDRVGGTG